MASLINSSSPSISSSFFSWGPSYDESIRAAEKSLLESIEWGDASFSTLDVPITFGDEAHTIHTIVASHPPYDEHADIDTYPIVLWHGYAQVPSKTHFNN